jgi:hypothetical protein
MALLSSLADSVSMALLSSALPWLALPSATAWIDRLVAELTVSQRLELVGEWWLVLAVEWQLVLAGAQLVLSWSQLVAGCFPALAVASGRLRAR